MKTTQWNLSKTVAENSHHNAVKLFGRGAMPKGQMIGANSADTGMLLERIDKMADVQNLLMDRLNIRNGSKGLTPVSLQEASPCANCSRFDHIELDCPVMAISYKVHWEDRLKTDDLIIRVHTLNIIIPLFSIILCKMLDLGGTMINPILHRTMVSSNNPPTRMKDNRRLSR